MLSLLILICDRGRCCARASSSSPVVFGGGRAACKPPVLERFTQSGPRCSMRLAGRPQRSRCSMKMRVLVLHMLMKLVVLHLHLAELALSFLSSFKPPSARRCMAFGRALFLRHFKLKPFKKCYTFWEMRNRPISTLQLTVRLSDSSTKRIRMIDAIYMMHSHYTYIHIYRFLYRNLRVCDIGT